MFCAIVKCTDGEQNPVTYRRVDRRSFIPIAFYFPVNTSIVYRVIGCLQLQLSILTNFD